MSVDTDPRFERETIIGYNESPDNAHVYTSNAALQRKLEALGVKPVRIHKFEGKICAKDYEVPKRWIKVSPPREMSMEQREKQRQRMLSRRVASEVELPNEGLGFEGVTASAGVRVPREGAKA